MLQKTKGLSLYSLPIAIFVCLLLSSCSEVEMIDSSSDPAYSFAIGQKIELKEDVWALGIASNDSLPADFVDLVPGVGYSGPEVVSRGRLKKGTVLRITKVLTAKVLFSTRIEYVVEEIGSNHLVGEQICIYIKGNINDVSYGLDSNYYEVIR